MSEVLDIIAQIVRSDAFAASVAAIGGALFSVIANVTARRLHAKKLQKKAKSEEFEAALASDNLATIGTYLRNELGKTDINDYLNDEETQSKINRYVHRLDDLVRIPEDSEEPDKGTIDNISEEMVSYIEAIEGDPEPIKLALQRINQGDEWTGLAALRRDLEKRLVVKFPSQDGRRTPPYRNVKDPDLSGMLRSFWYLASKAIHGEELNSGEMALAVKLARSIYGYIEGNTPQNLINNQ